VTAAFLAIVCGVISFLKREDLRYSATAAVIGGSALAFQFIIVAIVIAVILVLIVTVLNR
jgi:predicted branched-subunit amino acid permease